MICSLIYICIYCSLEYVRGIQQYTVHVLVKSMLNFSLLNFTIEVRNQLIIRIIDSLISILFKLFNIILFFKIIEHSFTIQISIERQILIWYLL